jgi:hypothetical protein
MEAARPPGTGLKSADCEAEDSTPCVNTRLSPPSGSGLDFEDSTVFHPIRRTRNPQVWSVVCNARPRLPATADKSGRHIGFGANTSPLTQQGMHRYNAGPTLITGNPARRGEQQAAGHIAEELRHNTGANVAYSSFRLHPFFNPPPLPSPAPAPRSALPRPPQAARPACRPDRFRHALHTPVFAAAAWA